MKVELVGNTPNPENICAKAFRSCKHKKPMHKLELEKDIDYYINKAIELGHESVLEHCTFTFSVEGISRACSHQLVRHRIASYSQKSQRYVGLKEKPTYIIPDSVSNDEKLFEVYTDFVNETFNKYKELEEEIPKEDARMVLPNFVDTNIVVTMNGRSLRHFLKLRLNESAQWEIRKLAEKMLKCVYEKAPNMFEDIKDEYLEG